MFHAPGSSAPGGRPYAVAFHPTEGPDISDPAAAWAVLSEAERERATRFYFERDRQRWIQGRAWIRRELAILTDHPAGQLVIAAEPGGRLYLPEFPGLDFNLSHTGGWIALATYRDGRIGVDLETVDPAFPALEIAAAFFLPEERHWIAAGPVERFFQLWTAKEALMKATGRGMSLEPDQIRVSCRDGTPSSVTNLETGSIHPVTTLPGPTGTVAAIVGFPHA